MHFYPFPFLWRACCLNSSSYLRRAGVVVADDFPRLVFIVVSPIVQATLVSVNPEPPQELAIRDHRRHRPQRQARFEPLQQLLLQFQIRAALVLNSHGNPTARPDPPRPGQGTIDLAYR